MTQMGLEKYELYFEATGSLIDVAFKIGLDKYDVEMVIEDIESGLKEIRGLDFVVKIQKGVYWHIYNSITDRDIVECDEGEVVITKDAF